MGAPGAGIGALYTGRGPVCGMIIRGGAAMGSAGFVGAAACICVTFEGGWVAGGALPTGVAGGMRGGTAIAGGAALADASVAVVVTGGVIGALGGITTTDGGRYVAATEAGVTILGGAAAGASVTGLGETAFGTAGAA
jgi:hypothetical protein